MLLSIVTGNNLFVPGNGNVYDQNRQWLKLLVVNFLVVKLSQVKTNLGHLPHQIVLCKSINCDTEKVNKDGRFKVRLLGVHESSKESDITERNVPDL